MATSWRRKGASTPSAVAVPITRNGAIGFQVENVMASVAAAWGVGLSWDAIRLGLKTFANDSDNAPGRFNVFDYKGATLIADYGHNPDAILALVQAVETMPAKRRVVVISGAGDRRDEDIRSRPKSSAARLTTCCCTRTPASVAAWMVKWSRCCARPERRTAHRTSRKSTASSRPSIPPGAPAGRRPVPDPDRPGGRRAGPHRQAHQGS
jgi:hypothetical protein